jgi:Fe-S oxidoreductase
MKLPLLEARAAETTLCTYCPKLCRPACPVSTVEGRETVTPWGKMRAMGEAARGIVPVDEARLSPAYACTGCMKCFELCELDNPVATTLRDGRAEALAHGVAPGSVRALVAGFAAREAALRRAAKALPQGEGPVGFVPGCTAVTFEHEGIPGIAAAIGALDAPCAVVADGCCGLPLLEAGDREGFAQRARAMAGRLARFERVVTTDAGCAHAMRVLYAQAGVALPPVRHLAETAAAALARVPALREPPGAVVYHDSCRLGRGLGVYEEPRAVLARLLGRAPGELPEAREGAPCSGAGGLLPVTRPATADAIARELGELAGEAGGETVVTACAASRHQLAGAGVRALDLAALLAQALSEQGT